MPKETILAIGAHNDDHIIGAGGTLARYAKEGKRVRTLIISFGEISPPHLKPEIVIKTRVKESLVADRIMGGKGVTYLGITESGFLHEIKDKRNINKLLKIIKQENPSKIFTHGPNDAHPCHMALYNVIKDLVSREKITCEVYSFDVWSVWRLRKRMVPRLVVNITQTFDRKIKAINAHKSQFRHVWAQFLMFPLLWSVYIKDRITGWNNKCKYAEVFDKIE